MLALRLAPLSILVPLVAACAVTPATKATARGLLHDGVEAEPAAAAADPAIRRAAAEAAPGEPADRRVIQTADFRVRVTDADGARVRLRETAKALGGFVHEETTIRVAFRVPADRFEEALRHVAELGPILERSVRAADVTEEYADLELRLAVKTRFLEELRALYEKGGDLKDLLEIKREIERVIEEIERLEGRIRYLADQVALSTIAVRLDVSVQPIDATFKLPFAWLEELGIERLLR